MKPVIFLLLICINSIISKTIHKKSLHFCIESEPLTQHGEKQVADGSDDKEDIQPSGYEAISTTLEPVVDIAENEKDSQNTSLLHQVDDIDDITIGSNDIDINEQSNESDINKGSSESDIITDINEEGNVTDINNESNDTGINNESNVTDMNNESDVTDINNESIVTDINNESNDNSTTQVNPTVIGVGIDPETEKSHVHDDSNENTENINNTSTETVNNEANITEKSADETNEGLNDEVQDNTDTNNMRKVRANLLDHLLVYFMNIIKQDKQYTHTRKKYSKDNMKLEDKLRNYYNPVHLDEFLYNNNSEAIDMEEYSNSRRDAEGTNEDIIVENKEDPVTTSNIIIEPLKLINITTDENPVNESCVTNKSISNDNLNKTEMADLNLQNENEQDDKTTNGKLLLKIEENADILPNGVAKGDNEREYSSTTKIYTNDVVTEKGLQNNENNIKSIKEIDGRRKILNSDNNKANNLKENSTQQNTEDKNANNTALDHRPAKKSIMVKIIDSLKIKGLKKLEGETEHLLNQNTVPRPYNLILQFNIHI